MSFIDDIQGQNTQLYPIVTIEPDYIENYNTGYEQVIHLSTNNVSLDHIHSLNYTLPILEGTNFKPLLLNIPSIKESIDIESRKFKISNVNLDISNIEYGGERFTDILSDTNLMNWRVSIQFVSPSAKMYSTIFSSGVVTGVGEPSFYDYYKDDVEHTPFMTQMVYQGVIRRISHDDTKVKISLEDLTEQKAHKNLPQPIDQNGVVGYLGDGENMPSKYRNKPIPMVYGHVDRSPLVFNENQRDLLIDSKEIYDLLPTQNEFNHWEQGLWILADDSYVNVDRIYASEVPPEWYQWSYSGNKITLNVNNIDIFPAIASGTTPFIIVMDTNRNFGITLTAKDNTLSNTDFIDEAQLNGITDGSTGANEVEFSSSRRLEANGISLMSYSGTQAIEFMLFRLQCSIAPSYDNEGVTLLGYVINNKIFEEGVPSNIDNYYHWIFNPIFSEDVESYIPIHTGQSDGIDGLSQYYWEENDPNLTTGNVVENDKWDSIINFTNAGNTNPNPTNPPNADGTGGADLHFSTWANQVGDMSGAFEANPPWKDADLLLVVLPSPLAYPDQLTFEFRTIWDILFNNSIIDNPGYVDFHFSLTGNFNNLNMRREVKLSKPLDQEFYANVHGRVNTFGDHPTLSVYAWGSDGLHSHANGWIDHSSHEGILDYYNTLDEQYWVNDHYHEGSEAELIQNPIDIIYDLVRSELGHDAIDEVEYAEAKAAHPEWKFGFTITKKINSKKLIEDIAKSTKCFPKFKNDGTFGFNTIKDSYTVSNNSGTGDYENAHLIKESEVISYSFKKSSPEQIYQKVDVQYYKDYAQDSLLKRTDAIDRGASSNYGIKSSSDAYLEFESDYIRDKTTAENLRNFLVYQYKNDHLIFSLKLPLQYINLEIGSLVKFRELFGGGVKAYGIDYRFIQVPPSSSNDQYYYPLFMITSTKKNLNSVSIECMQLHHLGGMMDGYNATQGENIAFGWYDGIPQQEGGGIWGSEEGLFYFPDSDPIVIPEPPSVPVGEFVNEVTIPPNSIAYFMLSEAEFNNPDDFLLGSSIALFDMMLPTKFSPSLFESFITDDIDNGIISIHDGFNDFYNESVTVANVEDWYSTYNSPYISMKMDFAQDLQFSGGETFICRDGYYELINLMLPSNEEITSNVEHEMVMWVVKQGDSHLFGNAWLDYHNAILDYNTHKVVALTNFSSETITYTPANQVDLISVDVGVATNPNNPTPPPLLLGDTTLDETLNVLDVIQIVQHTLGIHPLTGQSLANADVNQDETVNILDVVTLVNQILDI